METITRYRLALACAGRRSGLSVAECAVLAQYADAPTMRSAFCAHGLSLGDAAPKP